MEFKPLYYQNKLKIVNPKGYAGIITLWTPVDDIKIESRWVDGIEKKLRNIDSSLFQDNSPLVAISNLFGNGLPQMLANLAYNPQVERIAITGVDSQKSGEAFEKFIKGDFEDYQIGSVKLIRMRGTNYVIDPSLLNGKFKPEIERFSTSELEKLITYVKGPPIRSALESDRVKIELKMPEFKDFPSDLTNHNIQAKTPLEAWMEVMYVIDRFGVNINLGKGLRRSLFNLDVTIQDPSFESEQKLKKFNFDPDKLRKYQTLMLNPSLIDADDPSATQQPYTYGNRLREYWGGDALAQIAKLLKSDPLNRHGLVSLWDTSTDLIVSENSAPCFTDAYFINQDNKVMMTAAFRTHNATSAYFDNMYGLRAIQEEVSKLSGLEAGQINVRSRWISIDPENAKTISALELVKQNRRKSINVNDPRGYFTIDVDNQEIVATHYHPLKTPLKEYRGKNALTIKDQLRHDNAISDPDHAMWIGYELARAEQKLKGKLEEL